MLSSINLLNQNHIFPHSGTTQAFFNLDPNQDTFTPVTLKPMSLKPPVVINKPPVQTISNAAKVQPSGRKVDIGKIPFGVELEMVDFDWKTVEAEMKKAGIPLFVVTEKHKDDGWDVRTQWKLEVDISINKDIGCGGELVSRIMTKDAGGLEEVKKVYEIMRRSGGRGSQKASLHVHVGAKDIKMSQLGISNLVKMELENEPILYRIAQNGQSVHRDDLNSDDPMAKTKKYCRPLSSGNMFPLIHANTAAELFNRWYSGFPNNVDPQNGREYKPATHYHPSRLTGVNLNSYFYRGTIEFRIFNYSDNVEDYVDNVELVLHMIKAAEEKNIKLTGVHPWAKEKDEPVPQTHMGAFLSNLTPDQSLQKRWLNIFTRSGGKITKGSYPVDPDKEATEKLVQKNYKFVIGNAILTSAEAVDAVKKCGQSITVFKPNSDKLVIHNAEELKNLIKQT